MPPIVVQCFKRNFRANQWIDQLELCGPFEWCILGSGESALLFTWPSFWDLLSRFQLLELHLDFLAAIAAIEWRESLFKFPESHVAVICGQAHVHLNWANSTAFDIFRLHSFQKCRMFSFWKQLPQDHKHEDFPTFQTLLPSSLSLEFAFRECYIMFIFIWFAS